MHRVLPYLLVLVVMGGSGCGGDDSGAAPAPNVGAMFGEPVLDPTGNAPLAAQVPFAPPRDVTVTVRVAEPDGTAGVPRELSVSGAAGQVRIPILGLFPDHENEVTVAVSDMAGKDLGSRSFTLSTGPLPEDFPSFTATGEHDPALFTFLEFLRTPLSRPEAVNIMVDAAGRVRWYSTFPIVELHPTEVFNGTIYAGDQKELLVRYDFIGHELMRHDLSVHGYERAHHDIFRTDEGNLLVTVDRVGAPYIEDRVIAVRERDNDLRNRWNLADVLPDVADLFLDLPMTGEAQPGVTNDPIHINAVWHDPTDGGLIACSQRVGIAKVYRSGQLQWLLAPHLVRYIDDADGDGVSDSMVEGYDPDVPATSVSDFRDEAFRDERYPFNGKPTYEYSTFDFHYGEFLLTPLDVSGNPIEDENVRLGFEDHASFAWPFRPHAAMLTSEGNLLLFDNGLARNFGLPLSPTAFSRVVEYEIVADTSDGYGGTVRQVWEYRIPGAWHGMSLLVGDVDELPSGHRLVTSGALGSSFVLNSALGSHYDGPIGALVVEVDPADNREVHILEIERRIDDTHPAPEFTVYRAERVDPYAYWLDAPMGGS